MISVVIIGAGIAALLAGNELSRKGFDVTVLEAGETVSRPRAEIKLPYQLIWEAPLVHSNGKLVPITSASRLRSTINMILNLRESRMLAANGTLADFIKDEFESALKASTKDLEPELASEYLRHFEKIQCTRFCFDSFHDASKKVFPLIKFGRRTQRAYTHNTHNEVKVTPSVHLSRRVVSINYHTSNEKVIVHTADGTQFESDYVIYGLPLGVLKTSYESLFTPALPQEKINAIQGLGVGVVTLAYLEFARAPLVNTGWTGVNFLWAEREMKIVKNSSFSWILGLIGLFPISDNETNILWAVNQGSDAIAMEHATKQELFDGFKFLLSRFLNLPTELRPTDVDIKINKSYANQRGSFAYESVTAEFFEASRDDLKQPVLHAVSR